MKRTLYAVTGAIAAVVITTTSALAGSGVGGVFNLGQVNTVNQKSTLTGATPDPELVVQNTGAGTALSLIGGAGAPAFKVNSATKIVNLNADLLDGKGSSDFLAVTGTAANASKLSGLPPSSFWKTIGNGGTVPGTNFLGTTDNQALELKVNHQRALRIEPAPIETATPNIVGGFHTNAVLAGAFGATIAGGGGKEGSGNFVSDDSGTVGGGVGNRVGDSDGDPHGAPFATVAGGAGNTAGDATSTVGGGIGNTAGAAAVVAGGNTNTASGDNSAVAGGFNNTASGNFSAVAGGSNNTASDNHSYAAGRQAKATQPGSFVWGDNQQTDVTSPAANTFTVRAAGGIWLGTNSNPTAPVANGKFIATSTGAYLSSAGAWTNNSDRALKHDFRPLDRRSLLEKVARMPITSWSYRVEQPGIRHIGPMAQDFYGAFGLGLDNKHITTIDEGGVALAAIQGLYRQNQALERQNRGLRAQLTKQNARLTRLEHAFEAQSR